MSNMKKNKLCYTLCIFKIRSSVWDRLILWKYPWLVFSLVLDADVCSPPRKNPVAGRWGPDGLRSHGRKTMFWGLYTRPANTCWKMQVLYIMIYTYNNTYIYIYIYYILVVSIYVFMYLPAQSKGPKGSPRKGGWYIPCWRSNHWWPWHSRVLGCCRTLA